ncbi:MAG: PSD1 and planctomycete cytochrome C domain-containing protein [Pirellulales bacterium]
MPRVWNRSWRGLLWLWPLACTTLAAANEDPAHLAKLDFFERQVRPIFVNHCYACHSADTKPAGGLRVDDQQGLLLGGNAGAAVIPGQPDDSLLLRRVSADAKKRMPAEGQPLSDEQIAVLRKWIEEGAVWPALQVKVDRDRADYVELRQSHWAFQPLVRPAVPAPADAAWARDDVDRFVLAQLEARSLTPVADADKATLLRRITYDLTGLAPTPEELDAFLADESPSAYEQVVDRLLKSPAFGEQWGRHWLDVARYGESTGPSRNIPYPHAWRYRDYVIDAVNRDVPFTQFVREQVAGDLLPTSDDAQRNRQQIATGFLALGVKDVNQRFPIRFQMDNVDEQIDVVTRSILGLTVSCARCHDHKFDPVPQADYYALAGIFTSTEMHAGLRSQMGGSGLAYYVPKKLVVLAGELPPADPVEVERLTAEVKAAKDKWDSVRGTPEGLAKGPNGVPHQRKLRDAYEALQGQLGALTDPAARGLVAHGVRDAEKVGDTELRVRGEAEKRGPPIPRGYLTAFSVPGAPPVEATASGRLQLAQWLTSDANPLTSRVFVNRVWAHLFGRGIVGTVDNFGVTGTPPTHPELLDYLAQASLDDGWSLKRLVRRLVLTRTYQLGPSASAEHLARDPDNHWLWRHSPRRLTAEELRDSVLAAAGRLDRTRPEGSAVRKLRMVEMADNGGEAKSIHEQAAESTRRSLYLPQLRGLTPKTLEAFDPVEQTLVTGSREVTTVPSQALYLLNSPFVRKQALELSRRLASEQESDEQRVREAYRLALNRHPTETEIVRATAFIAEFAGVFRNETPLAAADAVAVEKANDSSAEAPTPPANPDEADQSGVAIREEVVRADDARTAAWLAFTQALFANAEFRYVR